MWWARATVRPSRAASTESWNRSFAWVVTEYSIPARAAAISAVRPASEPKWAWRWVMPRSAAEHASSIAWWTSAAS